MRLSRKNIFTTVLGFTFLCFVTSCSFVEDVVVTVISSFSTDNWDGETVSKVYNGSTVQYEIPNTVRTVELTATEAVDIFMVKMNVGTTTIPLNSTRYIVSTTGSGQGFGSLFSSRSAEEENPLMEIDDWENVSGITPSGFIRKDYAPARDFVPPALGSSGSGRSARLASVVSEPMKSTITTDLEVGATKDLWVDVPASTAGAIKTFVNSSNYTKRSATLQAKKGNCYIWVLNDNFTDKTASGDKITQTKAVELAEKFDSMYDLIKEVFGEESDEIISVYGFNDISTACDTGTKVNIVVYDIEDDYTTGQASGVAGYFWPKDYYIATDTPTSRDDVLPLSNEGKYFYVDSGFLNEYPDMIYSTLAHEFQHMINFGQKTMKSMETATKQSDIVSSSTWSNEMMSMVCEDMIQQHLGISAADSPISRLIFFAQGYYNSGLTDWLLGNDVAYSYAGAYAFGAYLARNYGGTSLIKQIATNKYVDQEAITQALKSNKATSGETFESVFKKYPQALVLNKSPKGVTVPTFNKSVNGIGGAMPKINLFDELIIEGKAYSIKPVLLSPKSTSRVNLRPYGFTLHSVGSLNSAGTVNITFSSPVNENEKIYLLVQPKDGN